MRKAVQGLTVAGILATSAVAMPATASAHDALVSTNPQGAATLNSAPANIELTFSESVMKVGNQVAVTSPDGNQIATTPSVSGAKVSAPFKAAGNGKYTVAWRVTSSDGHPVSGTFSFTLKGQAGTNSSAAASNAASESSSGNAMGKASASPSTVKGPTSPTTNEPGDNKPWLIGGGVALALALIGAGWYVAKGRVKDDPGAR